MHALKVKFDIETEDSIQVLDNVSPWCQGLKHQHKKLILDKDCLDNDIIDAVLKLLTIQFPHIGGMEPTGLVPLFNSNKHGTTTLHGDFQPFQNQNMHKFITQDTLIGCFH